MSDQTIQVSLTQKQDYQFQVDFGGAVPPLMADEPSPLVQGTCTSPVHLMAAAVCNYLSDSLLFVML